MMPTWFRRLLSFLLVMLAGGLTLVTLLIWLAGGTWAGDRCSHFTFYWAVAAMGLGLWAAWRKRWMILGPMLAVFVVHAVPVGRRWVPAEVPPESARATRQISLVSANLFAGNQRKAEAVDRLMQLDPDVLILMEVAASLRADLQPLLKKYPHHANTAEDTWMLSRFAASAPQLITLTSANGGAGPGGSPWPAGREWTVNYLVRADFLLGTESIRVVALHPPVPSTPTRVAQQFFQIPAYADALATLPPGGAAVLIGDFNTTPFSQVMKQLLTTTGLRDAAAGAGYRVTWGPRVWSGEPLFPWVGIPIDHTLVSPGVQVLSTEVGELPGSDHKWQKVVLKF